MLSTHLVCDWLNYSARHIHAPTCLRMHANIMTAINRKHIPAPLRMIGVCEVCASTMHLEFRLYNSGWTVVEITRNSRICTDVLKHSKREAQKPSQNNDMIGELGTHQGCVHLQRVGAVSQAPTFLQKSEQCRRLMSGEIGTCL